MCQGSIIKNKRGKNIYYYYSKSSRVKLDPNDEGKTRNTGKSKVVTENIYLGKAEEILKKMKENEGPTTVRKEEFGLPLSLWQMAKKIGLVEIIDNHVPKRNQGISIGEYITLAAISRISPNPVSKNKISSWIKKTALNKILGDASLTSQSFWNNFDQFISEKEVKKNVNGKEVKEIEEILPEDKISKIETDIWTVLVEKYRLILDVVLYDTSNFFTYMDRFTDSELLKTGKNKKGRNNKRQVGLSLAVLRGSQIPLFHQLYRGNVNDVTLFPTAIKKLTKRLSELSTDTKKVVLVFDKGNNSEKNLGLINDTIEFVGSLTPSHHRDLLGISLERYEEIYKDSKIYRTIKEIYGEKRAVLISYSEKLAKRQHQIFDEKLKNAKIAIREYFHGNKDKHNIKERILKKLKEIKIETAKADYYLEFEIKGNKLILRQNKKVDLKRLSFGKTIYFTSLLNESTEKIIDYYRKEKNQIEDSFKLLNNEVNFQPVRAWTDSKIRIHSFVCIISLLLLKLLEYLAAEESLQMSSNVLISELRDITEVILIYSSTKGEMKICEMTSIQKKLFNLYELYNYT